MGTIFETEKGNRKKMDVKTYRHKLERSFSGHFSGHFSITSLLIVCLTLLSLSKINYILFSKLFWPNLKKKCCSDWDKLLKFEAKGQGFAKNFVVTWTNYLNSDRSVQFLKQNAFLTWGFFLDLIQIEQFKLENKIEIQKPTGKVCCKNFSFANF